MKKKGFQNGHKDFVSKRSRISAGKKIRQQRLSGNNPVNNPEVRIKISNTLSKIGAWKKEKNPNWKGGIMIETRYIRSSIDTKIWRYAVFTRDNFTCQHCKKRGGNLHAHHIKEFSKFPELRFDINNGLTLCVSCHRAIHKSKKR